MALRVILLRRRGIALPADAQQAYNLHVPVDLGDNVENFTCNPSRNDSREHNEAVSQTIDCVLSYKTVSPPHCTHVS
jgi:hypothetical protein